MKDEIKEILDTPMFIIDDEGFTVYINDIINDYITNLQEYYNDNVNKYEELLVKYSNLQEELEKQKRIEQASLDTINNLQEKVNQYENPDDMTLFYMWLDEKAKDKIKQLQEENEKLKNRNDFLEKVCVGFDDKYENYKSRNEKAIEYIHKNYYEVVYKTKGTMENDLLNILNGGDE